MTYAHSPSWLLIVLHSHKPPSVVVNTVSPSSSDDGTDKVLFVVDDGTNKVLSGFIDYVIDGCIRYSRSRPAVGSK